MKLATLGIGKGLRQILVNFPVTSFGVRDIFIKHDRSFLHYDVITLCLLVTCVSIPLAKNDHMTSLDRTNLK